MSLTDALLLEPYPMDVCFAVRTDGARGSGTENDPYYRSAATDFDALMASIPANTTIHLGPGVFETRGCANGVAGGWEPKSGQRIVGSGMGITVLKLVEAVSTAAMTYAVGTHDSGTAFLDGFEVSDLTIDCNLAGQPVPQGQVFANLCCGAIFAPGRHIRIRRVRVIGFGTQNLNLECFPIFVGYSHPDRPHEVIDRIVEDCVVEEPSCNNSLYTTCISIGCGERSLTDERMGYHPGCVIRRCWVDCEYKDRPVPIATLTINSQTGIATEEPHWAITLYVPDRLLSALNGESRELCGILDGAPELDFIVPRWWEGSHTVRLGALRPAGEPQSQAVPCDESGGSVSTLQGVSAAQHAKPICLNRAHHG